MRIDKRLRVAYLPLNLLKLRESRGLTREKVCLETNLSNNMLTSWEEGTSGPSMQRLQKLCQFYQYPEFHNLLSQELRFSYNPLPKYAPCGSSL